MGSVYNVGQGSVHPVITLLRHPSGNTESVLSDLAPKWVKSELGHFKIIHLFIFVPKWVKLAPNGTNLGHFKIIFLFILAHRANLTNFCSKSDKPKG